MKVFPISTSLPKNLNVMSVLFQYHKCFTVANDIFYCKLSYDKITLVSFDPKNKLLHNKSIYFLLELKNYCVTG